MTYIYFILRQNEVVYVGRTKDINRRQMQERSESGSEFMKL